MIEKYEEIVKYLSEYGNKVFSSIESSEKESVLNFTSFFKGKKAGSKNYLEKQIKNSYPYIQVLGK